MKVSVIVPVYNTERYLEKCLCSLVNQTLEDIEIIIVNDGSTDDSQSIIDKYVKKYPRKVNSYVKENGGLSDARNYGISKAIGDFIGFVDSDDFVDTNMYMKLYDAALNEGADIVECGYMNYYEQENKSITSEYETPLEFKNSIPIRDKDIIIDATSMSWNKLYKKFLFHNYNIKFPIGLWYEDYSTTPLLISKARKYALIDYIGYYYLQRDNSIIHSMDVKNFDKIEGFYNVIMEMKRLNEYDNFKVQLYYQYISLIFVVIERYFVIKKSKTVKVGIKNIIDRLYVVSVVFENELLNENNKYFKTLGKLIINKQYFKFSINIHLRRIYSKIRNNFRYD